MEPCEYFRELSFYFGKGLWKIENDEYVIDKNFPKYKKFLFETFYQIYKKCNN